MAAAVNLERFRAVVAFETTGDWVDLARGCTEPPQYLDAIAARLAVLSPTLGG